MYVKNLELGNLLDFYGSVLPDEQREVLSAYYFEDLSLAEIAETSGMTRQGVRAAIKRGEKQLLFLEERLGLCCEYRRRERDLAEVASILKTAVQHAESAGSFADAEELKRAAALAENAVSPQK